MRIVASYQTPRWYHYRKHVGINTYANRSEPDGFEVKYIYSNSFEELESSVKQKTFYTTHQDSGRPMKLSDLSIKIED